uniref:Tyrosine-protein kinase ephrin type A/B receptor-like domain-containing protein n=1 Tax=Tetradesmus obliquus TaxID=3088 RepID=A0A383VZZ0_TETOB
MTAQVHCLNCGSFGLVLASNKSTCELPAGRAGTANAGATTFLSAVNVSSLTGVTLCPSSHYCPGGSSIAAGVPQACPAGITVNNPPGISRSDCNQIEAGLAPVNAGSALLSGSSYSILQVAAAVACPIGWACPEGVIPGAATPVACPYAPILTTQGTGSTSLAQCKSIQAGYAPRDSSGPILTAIATVASITGTAVCPQNYYCQGGIVTGTPNASPGIPVRCPGDLGTSAASATNIGENNCTAPPGYAYVAGAAPSATACPVGQYKAGYNKLTSCSTCPTGLTTSGTVSTSANDCKLIAAGLAPVIASAVQTSPVAAAAVSTVTTTQCPAGSVCIGGDITTSAGIPVACSSLTTGLTSAPGSDSADDCNITLPGYGYNAATPANATLCVAGSYNAGGNQAACTSCSAGLTTISAGATSITDCNSTLPGYGYISGTPANATLCAAGTYNTGGNQLDCQACTNGLTTQSAGSSFCSAPPGYYYSSAKSAVACTSGTYQDSYTSTPATACLNCTSDTASYSPRTSASDCYTPTAVAVQAVSASILTSSTGDIIEWQDRSNAGIWTSVAVDASGRYMAAAQSGGLLWYSQDKGVNWTAIANSGSRNWVSLKQHMHGSACC